MYTWYCPKITLKIKMKKITSNVIIILAFLFKICLFNNCQNNKRINDVRNSENIVYIEDSISNIAINDNLNFNFKLIVSADSISLNQIRVYQKKELIQTINIDNVIWSKYCQFLDWNFDGFKDLSIRVNCSATGMCTYWVWNFNPSTNKFILNKDVSGILGWEIDRKNKQLINYYREGANHEFKRVYKYIIGKLKLIKSIDKQIYNYDSVLWKVTTTKKFEGDKIIRSKDSTIISN